MLDLDLLGVVLFTILPENFPLEVEAAVHVPPAKAYIHLREYCRVVVEFSDFKAIIAYTVLVC
jgi:hypothetical protein